MSTMTGTFIGASILQRDLYPDGIAPNFVCNDAAGLKFGPTVTDDTIVNAEASNSYMPQETSDFIWNRVMVDLEMEKISGVVNNTADPNVASGTDAKGDTTGFVKNVGTETLTSSTDWCKNGSRSLKVQTPGGVEGEGVHVVFDNLVSGQQYTYQITVKAPTNSDITMTMGESFTNFNGNGKQETFTVTFTATGVTHWLNIRTHTIAQAITFYIDEIIFVKGTNLYLNPPLKLLDMGANLTGRCKWFEGVTGLNGITYGIPFNSPYVLEIDAATKNSNLNDMGLGLADATDVGYEGDCSPQTGYPDARRWLTGVLGDDGKIYCPPFQANGVLVIDTNTTPATASIQTFGLDFSDTYKFRSAIKAPNGKIYCLPYNSSTILIINPATGTATRSNLGAAIPAANSSIQTSYNKWIGAVLVGTKIIAIPCNSNYFLVVETSTDTAHLTNMGLATLGNVAEQFYDGALGADGLVYGMPNQLPYILKINPVTETASMIDYGLNLAYSINTRSLSHLYTGAVAYENYIIGVPCDAHKALIIDTSAQKGYLYTMGLDMRSSLKWRGGVTASTGEILFIPTNATTIGVFDPSIDPSFEMDYQNGNIYPKGYNILDPNTANCCEDGTTSGFASVNSATLTADATTYYEGSYSLKVSTPGIVQNEGVTVAKKSVTIGKKYSGKVRLRGSGTVYVAINEYDYRGNWLRNSIIQSGIALTSSWQTIDISGIVTTGTYANIGIGTSGSAQNINFNVDTCQLNVGNPQIWVPGTTDQFELDITLQGITDKGDITDLSKKIIHDCPSELTKKTLLFDLALSACQPAFIKSTQTVAANGKIQIKLSLPWEEYESCTLNCDSLSLSISPDMPSDEDMSLIFSIPGTWTALKDAYIKIKQYDKLEYTSRTLSLKPGDVAELFPDGIDSFNGMRTLIEASANSNYNLSITQIQYVYEV